jgi:D-alanyl-lipoteichoic acid acyltransferase DltB (MBOAT superfamily)
MSFISPEFGTLLALGLAAFYLSPPRLRAGVLLVFSYVYYATWSVPATLLLFAVTTTIYLIALRTERQPEGRLKLPITASGVMALLLLLVVFKCGPWLSGVLRLSPGMALIAPLGLSYYLFKAIGYLLDVYWEKIVPQRSFALLALYVSFFPQMVSGPIQRPNDFFRQLANLRRPDPEDFVAGLRRILWGLMKKVLLADRLAEVVTRTHANPSGFAPPELIFGAYCYAIELYADFSGLTDIAIGIGLLFGVRGPENFNLPYFAGNIQNFWRRWHMSLTSWLTDYLFLPLRMSLRRLGVWGLSMAILVNMVAVGLWHGPKWTFLAFGIINGLFMIISVLTLKRRTRFSVAIPGLRVSENSPGRW